MITTLARIRAVCQDLRLNPNNTQELRILKLRFLEDLCTEKIIQLEEANNGNN